MYLKKSISWNLIGFQFFLLILLQACSDPKGDPAPAPTEVVSTAKSCQTDRSFFDKFVADNYSAVKTSDGGKLYDKWWATLSKTAPTIDHPLWASRAKDSNGTAINARSGGDSWRCKECHGWDYKGANGAYNTSNSHYTNFTGISAAVNDTNSDLFCKIRDGLGIDVLHKFNPDNTSGALTDLSVLALTKFVREGQVEVNDFIDATTAVATGDATAGEIVFTQATPASCANAGCHGAEGTNFNLSLGALSLENPWEVLHKIRFGQPGAFMPAFSETISEIEVKDVLAFAQTLSSTIPVQTCSIASAAFVSTGFAAANAAQGGRLYDNWIAELGVSAPAADHPLWVGRATNIDGSFANSRSGADSWRCKECHGWDYNGKDGAYNIASSHYTGFSGVLNAVSKTPIEVFCLIRDGEGIDPAHGFTPVLTANKLSDEHVLAMTKFILDANQMGMIDTTAIIPASGTVTGDALAGETVFKNIAGCGSVACHGPEGRKNGGGNSIGQLAFENPWEVLHKLRNGQAALGSPMPSFVTRLSDLQAQDLLAFAQTNLPRSTGAGNGATACRDEMNARGIDTLLTNVTPWDGGQLYDKWWAINETPPSIDHPLWALQNFNTRSGSATWRCKECHGWDYKGDAGAYSSGNSHFTGFTGILASASKTAADIFCAIRDGEGINV
ncbi:MAG: c-type cytochrome, partial [Thiohalomonadales bacterium]